MGCPDPPPLQRENREGYIAKLERDLASLPSLQDDGVDSDGEESSSSRMVSMHPSRMVCFCLLV